MYLYLSICLVLHFDPWFVWQWHFDARDRQHILITLTRQFKYKSGSFKPFVVSLFLHHRTQNPERREHNTSTQYRKSIHNVVPTSNKTITKQKPSVKKSSHADWLIFYASLFRATENHSNELLPIPLKRDRATRNHITPLRPVARVLAW